jgi:hypothetical protein
MANTHIPIATVTVGSGGANTIVFSSIPATYTDLKILFNTRTDMNAGRGYIVFRYNSVAANYSYRYISMYDSAYTTAYTESSQIYGQLIACNANGSDTTANSFGSGEIYIPNYAGSNSKISNIDSVTSTNLTSQMCAMSTSLSADTSAITSITLYATDLFSPMSPNKNFMQYSTATLYGIKNS